MSENLVQICCKKSSLISGDSGVHEDVTVHLQSGEVPAETVYNAVVSSCDSIASVKISINQPVFYDYYCGLMSAFSNVGYKIIELTDCEPNEVLELANICNRLDINLTVVTSELVSALALLPEDKYILNLDIAPTDADSVAEMLKNYSIETIHTDNPILIQKFVDNGFAVI